MRELAPRLAAADSGRRRAGRRCGGDGAGRLARHAGTTTAPIIVSSSRAILYRRARATISPLRRARRAAQAALAELASARTRCPRCPADRGDPAPPQRRLRGRRGPRWQWSPHRGHRSCPPPRSACCFEVGRVAARPALGLLALGAGASPGGERARGAHPRPAPARGRAAGAPLARRAPPWWPTGTGSTTAISASPTSPPGGAGRPQRARPAARPRAVGAAERRHERGAARPAPRRPRGASAVHRPDRAPPRSRGRGRLHSISGEPRFGAGGRVPRLLGRRPRRHRRDPRPARLRRSETRYRELFERSPSPLLPAPQGHRLRCQPVGRAPVRLRGHRGDERACAWRELPLRPANRNRARLDRIARLERLPVGEGVPVTRLRRPHIDGRLISVQATGVRVDTASGPATLAIMFDITARQRRRGGAAALRGDAVAAVRHQPRLHRAVRARLGPPHARQRRLHARSPASPPRRWSAAPPPSSASGTTRTTASRLRAELRRRRPRRRDLPARDRHPRRRGSLRCWCRPRASRWTGATTS